MYLGHIDEHVIDNDKYLTRILLTASKKAITRNWYKIEPPSTEQWVEIVRQIYILEKMTYQLRLRENIFANKWRKWITYDTIKDK